MIVGWGDRNVHMWNGKSHNIVVGRVGTKMMSKTFGIII